MDTFKIITLGCKVNQFESASLRASLLEAGLKEAIAGEGADMTVVNTCIVTQSASGQSRQAIRRAIKENPLGRTAAIGCYAQVFPEEVAAIAGVSLVAGNTVKGKLPAILMNSTGGGEPHLVLEDFSADRGLECLPIKTFFDRTRAFLKIQDGCRSFCSYCIVPFARGPLRSLNTQEVISMLNALSEEGYREVVLTGIHLGQYGADLNSGIDLERLLGLIGSEGLPLRIRLSSIEPNEVGEGLIEMMATEDWLCRHFHIPLQSGDNAVLRKMNRRYTAQAFAKLIEQIHRRVPRAAIGVDAMAGFPGEDERAYQNTFSLVRDLPVSYLHVFPFSPREGTPAARFSGQISQKLIKERARELRGLGQRKRHAFYRSCLGYTFSVLAQGWESEPRKMARGLSDNYLPVTFPSVEPTKNRLIPVRIEKATDNVVIGRPLTSLNRD
jgi:threonylcarbamoyladenosine tRNA methylthiotransferase MtaB